MIQMQQLQRLNLQVHQGKNWCKPNFLLPRREQSRGSCLEVSQWMDMVLVASGCHNFLSHSHSCRSSNNNPSIYINKRSKVVSLHGLQTRDQADNGWMLMGDQFLKSSMPLVKLVYRVGAYHTSDPRETTWSAALPASFRGRWFLWREECKYLEGSCSFRMA